MTVELLPLGGTVMLVHATLQLRLDVQKAKTAWRTPVGSQSGCNRRRDELITAEQGSGMAQRPSPLR